MEPRTGICAITKRELPFDELTPFSAIRPSVVRLIKITVIEEDVVGSLHQHENVNESFATKFTSGEKLASRVANFGETIRQQQHTGK